MRVEKLKVNSTTLAYQVFGSGKVNIVIELALNSCIGEWTHLANKLSSKYTVLLYERAGYGLSGKSTLKRTAENIAKELNQLLSKIEHEEKIILIGHSQGGLYVQQFAKLYPDLIEGVILIDPLTAYDNDWKNLLTSDEFKMSGVDKNKNLKFGYYLAKLGLGFLLRPLFKMSPPFYYYKDFSKEETKYMLRCMSSKKHLKAAVDEYYYSHLDEELEKLKDVNSFPDVPLVLVTHDSEFAINETIHFGGVTKETAVKIENIWQDMMKKYLEYSIKSKLIQAKNSGHFLHLTEFNLVEEAIYSINEMI